MRNDEPTTIEQLSCGMKIAYRHRTGAPADYCGVLVHAGSRNDAPDLEGMAHFVEHTIFKGTAKRSSWHIINRMERVGGELNAYTTKEETVVYTAAPTGNIGRATELLADLITGSRFPDDRLDKEREVVADEINSYLDSPAEAVFDDFEELIYTGTPLAHNILGNTEAIARMDSATCCDYLRKWYSAPNMVFFYCGSAGFRRVKAVAERYFSTDRLPRHQCQHIALPDDFRSPTFHTEKNIGLHQAHTVMGCTIGGMHSKERYANALVTNILGGPGMNSLLNVSLREKRGLVYSVEASSSLMSDTGLFTVYFGCDPDDNSRCISLVRDQIARLADEPMSLSRLSAAKKQYIGQLRVASDNADSMAISAARGAMYYNKVLSSAKVRDIIEAITSADIRAVAERLTNLSILTLK